MKKNPKKNFKLVYAEVFVITNGSSPVRVGFYVENEHKEFIHVCNQKRQKIVPSALIGHALNGSTISALLEPVYFDEDLSTVSIFAQPGGGLVMHIGNKQRKIYVDLKKREVNINFLSSATRMY